MSLQVAPEIEAKVREVAAARGVSVDIVLDEALRLLERRRNAPVSRRVPPGKDRSREMDWVVKPDLRYVNECVVLEGSEVVAHGPDAKTVYDEARSKGIVSPFIHFVHEPNPTPRWMGWQGTEE